MRVILIQFDVLEQDAFEVLKLIRSWKNSVAPINRIPPEILALLPDFWDEEYDRDKDVIALTHVCQTWRAVFTSRPSLWTDLGCVDMDKTLIYLKRSKPLPISVWLHRAGVWFSHRPFFVVVPQAIERLKSLSVDPGNMQEIIPHLSSPAPLLRELSVRGCRGAPRQNPVLTSTLFNGDLSSLQKLHLEYIITELPWRNMVNLTTLELVNMLQPSIKRLLDFFESAPHLREVKLHSSSPRNDAQDGRFVSLRSLKSMCIGGSGWHSPLLDHLLIPVGARLEAKVDLLSPIGNHPQKFIDNLRNLPDFTSILLVSGGKLSPRIEFSGPNGQVIISPNYSSPHTPCLSLGSLVQFDTSKTERLEIIYGSLPASDSLRQTLLPMRGLCTLVLERCGQPHPFINALDPSRCSTGALVCPKLEELIIECEEEVDIERVIRMAKARALRGARLKLVRIASKDKFCEIGGDGDGGGCGSRGYVATL